MLEKSLEEFLVETLEECLNKYFTTRLTSIALKIISWGILEEIAGVFRGNRRKLSKEIHE